MAASSLRLGAVAAALWGAAAVTPSPTHPPSPVPTIFQLCSEVTCDGLGWTNAASYGSTSVCGETNIRSATDCPEAMDWDALTCPDDAVDAFAAACADAAAPITDHRSTAEYRRHAVRVLTGRSLRRCLT